MFGGRWRKQASNKGGEKRALREIPQRSGHSGHDRLVDGDTSARSGATPLPRRLTTVAMSTGEGGVDGALRKRTNRRARPQRGAKCDPSLLRSPPPKRRPAEEGLATVHGRLHRMRTNTAAQRENTHTSLDRLWHC
ncbi:hypothetical protein MRX96_056981 [Rhipicephalus microplus]